MRKKYYISIVLVIIFISVFICISLREDKSNTLKEVVYNGDNLLISINGVASNTLPTSGTYYLVDYDCKSKNTKITWDNTNYKLNITNKSKDGGVVCNLTFKSNPKLSEMPVGSYIKYVGKGGMVGDTAVACQTNGPASSSTATAETESPNSCLGQNAREDIDTNGNTYGYCNHYDYKYYTTGWRIAYIDEESGKPYIISAGSPECNTRTSSKANKTYINLANTKAMKYCNNDYVDGDCSCLDNHGDGICICTDSDSDGLCDEIENGEVDAWAVSDIDFYNMTKAISGVGKRLYGSSSSLGDSGGTLGSTLYCGGYFSREECGYNNDLIDNGGFYWFASRYSSSSNDGVIWAPNTRHIIYDSSGSMTVHGLRPVISLQSSVYVTGGEGTIDKPYTIGNNTFSINNESKYINSYDDRSNVVLNLMSTSDVTQMCISVGSSGCSNYVDYASTYTLDWSSEADGEKIIYVYYKDVSGKIVASMSRSVILDTTVPSNNSVSIGSGSGLDRTLTLSSSGADYMCISNTSSDVNQCTEWVDYASTYSWRLSGGEGQKTVYTFFKDKAGNVGSDSDTITYTKPCLGVSEVITIDYSGKSINTNDYEIKLCAGNYRLQLWGAQGGNTGGKGGYSTGDITLNGNETLYFYVGGAGGKGTAAGFNGGGATGSSGGAGGGATDIRINRDSLYARVIVAGGGGGKGQDSCAAGGAGGGTSGIGGLTQGSCKTQGGAGTQTAGGAVGVYNTTNGLNPGTFGDGGAAADGSYDGGGGGGGWYGGGAGASSSWSNGGGGGSGFVYTSGSTLPSGYLLSSTYYLSNASTIAGDQSTIPTTSGTGTETGHSENGFIKITRLS